MDARRFLSGDERAAVEAAVARAERTTAAEFVCAAATESGRYDRAESLLGLLVGLLGLALLHALAAWAPAGAWPSPRGVALAEAAAAVVAGFALGSGLASRWRILRRPLVASPELNGEVARAADHVFAAGRLAPTRARGGVLLFVSLFERRVVVLADTGAMAGLGTTGVAALRDLAVERLRDGRRLEVFTDTIGAAAARLARPLPPGAEAADEVPNALLVFHPRP